jgi:hypothetical protein
MAGTHSHGIYISTDNGTIWNQVNNGLSNNIILSFLVNGNNVFVGTGNGLFLSTNNGAYWQQVGLENIEVLSLNIRRDYIYAGTGGSGVFKRPLSEITGVSKEINTFPKDFTLSQNYPNPFNPNTVIIYSLPLSSNIKLIIYNTLGQSIKTLESGYKPAGNYSINFNASGLPSGIYFYKLEAGSFSQTKKMMFIK